MNKFPKEQLDMLYEQAKKVDDVGLTTHILQELKEYRDLEEQGQLLKLPCKVRTTVYVIDTIYECDNDYMDCIMEFPDRYQCERGFKCEYEHEKLVVRPESFDFKMLNNFNKTVFLTKEEAEKALERLEKDNELY